MYRQITSRLSGSILKNPFAIRSSLRFCSGFGDGFTDPEFQPQLNSITEQLPKAEGTNQLLNSIEWARACTLGTSLFEEDHRTRSKISYHAEPDDLDQGALGDCWVLAALSALAECNDGKAIRDLFVQTEEEERQHKYRVVLFDARPEYFQFREWVIDDWIPCTPSRRGDFPEPCYVKAAQGAFWPLLVEKAFAKFFGDFTSVAAGWSVVAFEALTGVRGEMYVVTRFGEWARHIPYYEKNESNPMKACKLYKTASDSSSEEFWQMLKRADDTCALMAAGTDNTYGGFIESHAYTFLGVFEKEDGGRIQKFLKLRNPWGRNDDPRLDQDALSRNKSEAERLGFASSEDEADGGIAWCPFENFTGAFDSVYVDLRTARTKR